MKKTFCLLLTFLLALSGCALSNTDSSSESEESVLSEEEVNEDAEASRIENEEFLRITDAVVIPDEVLLGVKSFRFDPDKSDLIAPNTTYYTEDSTGVYLYVVPRYVDTKIKVERLAFNDITGNSEITEVLFELDEQENCPVLLQTTLPEGGPKIRVTVTINDESAVFEPSYDGKGDTEYPVIENNIYQTEHIYNNVFSNGPNGSVRTLLAEGDNLSAKFESDTPAGARKYFSGWVLEKLEVSPVDPQVIQAGFSGATVLKGNLAFSSSNEVVQFYVAEESQRLLPHAENDTRDLVILLENTDDIKRMIGENSRKIENCEIVIRDYQIDLAPSAWNTAMLTHIAIDSLGEEYPNFVRLFGDWYNMDESLSYGHFAISDKNVLYHIGNTVYRTIIDDVVDATMQQPIGYCFLKEDGILVDVNNNVVAKEVERCDENSFYRGTSAYALNSDGKEVMMHDNALKVWRANSETLRWSFVLDTGGDLYYYGAYGKAALLYSEISDFDVSLASHQSRPSSVYALHNDDSLWSFDVWLSDKLEIVNSKIVADDVKHLSARTGSPDFDALFITNSDDLFLYSHFNGSEYVMSDVKEISSEAAPVTIKNDGTIWYWGFVPWQPREHVFSTLGASVGEMQPEPILLSLDSETNWKHSRERMEAWLHKNDVDPRFAEESTNKIIALKRQYNYYSSNFRYVYTEEELETYRPK